MPRAPEPRDHEPRTVAASNAGLFALGGTRSFIVGRRRVAVVDPGPADPDHLGALASEVANAAAGVILLTHDHPDHAAGAPGLHARTGFPVRGSRQATGGEPLRDGEAIATDAGPLRVIATPGHAPDHLAFHLEESGVVLVGDLLLGQGDTTWVGEYPRCVADYLRSLDRLAALGARRLLPAHGPPIEDPADAIRRFRTHRLERIAQVERALGEWDGGEGGRGEAVDHPDALVDWIVGRVYGDALPDRLRTAAAWSVRGVLEYLGRMPFPAQGAPVEGGDRFEGDDRLERGDPLAPPS